MTFLDVLGVVFTWLGKIVSFLLTFSLIAVAVIVVLTILMPENALKALEILRGLGQ